MAKRDKQRDRAPGGGLGRPLLAAALFLLIAPAAPAALSDLAAFLQRTERMADYPKAVRADIRIEQEDRRLQAMLVVDPARGRLFLALREPGWRGLMPLGWGNGKAVANSGKRTVSWNVDDPLPGTELRPMEFFPFWRSDYERAFISDENRLEKTITFYSSDDSPYALLVITFDKTTLVSVDAKYYKETMSNLVRIRHARDYVMVGSRPRPQALEFHDFVEARATKASLRWRLLETVPAELMDEERFAQAAIDWPAR